MFYQIIFSWGDSSKSFIYFDADENPEQKAAEEATKYIEARKVNQSSGIFSTPFRAPRSLKVVEYDKIRKGTKRGGHKFKLHLMFVSATFKSGRQERNEWYEHIK